MEKWALITGAAKRIGRAISEQLHHDGFNLILHYHESENAAQALKEKFNRIRPESALCLSANLTQETELNEIITQINKRDLKLQLLVNNASNFTPSPLGQASFQQAQTILQTNLLAPYMLAQGLFERLSQEEGQVINLLDIHAKRPLKAHGLYSISKAALEMATLSLAQEMAPRVRVNGIAPGAILWPEHSDAQSQKTVIDAIPLQTMGTLDDIAKLVSFLVKAPYITGQIIAVDGGRSATGFKGAEKIG